MKTLDNISLEFYNRKLISYFKFSFLFHFYGVKRVQHIEIDSKSTINPSDKTRNLIIYNFLSKRQTCKNTTQTVDVFSRSVLCVIFRLRTDLIEKPYVGNDVH